ncbi:hypothetical protein Tdes44962_MAKER05739 [Teratosphaeria destructans]|uniref:Uncharacterized protein n=1 Tax=Teratosphaeria destructans TaxID=418781 RepID=A0A9W7SJN6_9PEZI|nr:hypothetical protein Tdes44962_MAKER05739 [Teratosphaeria destructans]
MPKPLSWHIPYVPSYGAPPAHEILFVLFLEKLPDRTISSIIEKLEDCDREWGKPFNVDIKPRKLRPVPWIRNYWPASEAILQYASRQEPSGNQHQDTACYRSYILIDSGWDANTCIGATWVPGTKDGEHVMVAARVPMAIANLVLTMIDEDVFSDASVNPLKAALGDDTYEENKVDFYKDHKVIEPFPEPRSYQPPAFLPKGLRMSKSKPTVISLLPLDDNAIQDLALRIGTGNGESAMPDLQLINWEGEAPTRQYLVKLFGWIESNSRDEDRIGYTFFIDNVLQECIDGEASDPQTWTGRMSPRVIAVSRTAHFGIKVPDHQISILPIKPESVVPLWRAACDSIQASDERTRQGRVADDADELQYGNVFGRERVIDFDYQPLPRKSLQREPRKSDTDDAEANEGMDNFATVWLLRPFSLDEERWIRRAFTALYSIEEGEDYGKEFAYIQYPWPSPPEAPTRCRSLQDLRDLFQKSDPMSPFYDPENTAFRMDSYPHHFFAVDDTIVDAKNPRVWLASSLDFYHESNEMGWYTGLIPPEEAGNAFCNLEIANLGPGELIEGSGGEVNKLWLGDLTPGEADIEDDQDADEVASDQEGIEDET